MLFVVGLAFAVNEVIVSPPADMGVLVFAGGMMGLPAFLRADEKDRGS